MKLSFDRFRQIFWMVTAVTFLVLLFFFLVNSSSYIVQENVSGVTILFKINKLTGKTEVMPLHSEALNPYKWTDISKIKIKKND